MRFLPALILIFNLLLACGQRSDNKPMQTETTKQADIAPLTGQQLESAVIYEANIRQYSKEGTFEAFTRDIPKLKELGVKVLWLMPIYPISKARRKATPELMADQIEDPEEREKYLGSYYAVSDYQAINPEFGTLDDFRELVRTAHENGLYVILDWVPNHTGWDHIWIEQHPDFYTKNAQGEITDPLNPDGSPVGWADVADLNYDNPQLRRAMTDAMLYWLVEEGIDGFRCDMAGMVPLDYWQAAIPELRAVKPIFMLAEWEDPAYTSKGLFDMAYGWEVHHLLNAIAKGEKDVYQFDAYMDRYYQKWPDHAMLMNFVTNHDENSWAGSVPERMGTAAPAITALTYCMPGMPLIYSGQEYGLDFRLKFFEKDQVPKVKGEAWNLLENLGHIKNEFQALHGGPDAASYQRIQTSDNKYILAFKRQKGDSQFVYLANMSSDRREFTVDVTARLKDLISGAVLDLNPVAPIALKPWEFRCLQPAD
jgi:1,4-alpha-glucan branching enzyme